MSSETGEFKSLRTAGLDNLAAAFVDKLATFALRRATTATDRGELAKIADRSKAADYRLAAIGEALVLSDLFEQCQPPADAVSRGLGAGEIAATGPEGVGRPGRRDRRPTASPTAGVLTAINPGAATSTRSPSRSAPGPPGSSRPASPASGPISRSRNCHNSRSPFCNHDRPSTNSVHHFSLGFFNASAALPELRPLIFAPHREGMATTRFTSS